MVLFSKRVLASDFNSLSTFCECITLLLRPTFITFLVFVGKTDGFSIWSILSISSFCCAEIAALLYPLGFLAARMSCTRSGTVGFFANLNKRRGDLHSSWSFALGVLDFVKTGSPFLSKKSSEGGAEICFLLCIIIIIN